MPAHVCMFAGRVYKMLERWNHMIAEDRDELQNIVITQKTRTEHSLACDAVKGVVVTRPEEIFE